MKLATMDIGSGTVRVMLCEVEEGGFRRDVVHRVITRLADDFTAGVMSRASMERTVDAAREMAREARAYGAVEIRVSCTGVTRRAANAGTFLQLLHEGAGVTPSLISGELEAALSSLGAAFELNFGDAPFVLLDIGGFSTEIARIRGGKAEAAISMDLGSVSLAARHLRSDPPTVQQLQACTAQVQEVIASAAKLGALGDFGPLVGTAGTITNLAAMSLKMERYEPGRLNRTLLTPVKIQELLDLLISLPAVERLSLPGLEKGREDTIPAGMIICREVMDYVGAEKMIVTEGGVLEGLAVWPQWPPTTGTLLTV